MADEFCQLWWMFTIKGLVSIVFALTCYVFSSFVGLHLLEPMGFLYLLVVFTFYICLIGIVMLVGAIYAFDQGLKHRRLLLADAALNLVIGPAFLMTFGFGLKFSMVVVLFGAHALIVGLGYLAISLRMVIQDHRYLFLSAAALWSILCGGALILYRDAHEEAITVGVAIYTAILGLLLVFLSARFRGTERKLKSTLTSAA
jgi:hypothetical protein